MCSNFANELGPHPVPVPYQLRPRIHQNAEPMDLVGFQVPDDFFVGGFWWFLMVFCWKNLVVPWIWWFFMFFPRKNLRNGLVEGKMDRKSRLFRAFRMIFQGSRGDFSYQSADPVKNGPLMRYASMDISGYDHGSANWQPDIKPWDWWMYRSHQ